MANDKLIFDLGFHNGDDSDYYLAKGYKVVAVEANPYLAEEGQRRFRNEIKNGHLILINKAISSEIGKVDFYVHPKNSDWSSCFIDIVRSDGSDPNVVSIESTSLHQLYETYGIPYFIKVDLEGYDVFTAKQVFEYQVKPEYISFETSRRDYAGIFSYLYVAGYKKFQLVNQANNPSRKAIINSNEDSTLAYEFTKFSSGLFGDDLPKDCWLTFDEALSRYMKYKELKQIDNKELGLGWLDVHAKLE